MSETIDPCDAIRKPPEKLKPRVYIDDIHVECEQQIAELESALALARKERDTYQDAMHQMRVEYNAALACLREARWLIKEYIESSTNSNARLKQAVQLIDKALS